MTLSSVGAEAGTSRALITGADGFVGPYLKRHLVECGDDVSTTSGKDGPDLLDGPAWNDLVSDAKPQVIYHLAGWSDVGGSWQDPLNAFRVNAEGTLSVLQAARHANVERVLIVSSADVYGVVGVADLPLTEQSAVQPSSPYGASKVAAEVLGFQSQRGWGLDVVVARPFNHIGPGQSPNFVTSAFATRIAQCEQAGGGTLSHGNLSPKRDLNDVRDVVRAYRLLATAGTPGEIYNICSGVAVAMSDILERLLSKATVEVSPEVDPELFRPVDLPVLLGNHDKITRDTGWEPAIPLSESLSDVLNDARQRLANA